MGALRAPASEEPAPAAPVRSGARASSVVSSHRTAVAVAAVVTVGVVVPAVVALWVLRTPTWHPILDWAQTEGRVRDVGTRHTPLTSTPGRFVGLGTYGDHPGPLVFYALAPVYRLTGASSFSLTLATTALNLAAVAASVWVARRRGGWPLALATAGLMAVLFHAVSAEHVVLPWNPWLTLWWWVVFLLAVWSVLCDDAWMLPVAAFAGSLCAQTHVSYVPMVGAMAALLVVWLVAWRRRHARGDDDHEARHRERARRAGVAAAVVLAVAWLPVAVDTVVTDPSNAAVLWDFFTAPGYEAVGLGPALQVMVQHLDVVALVAGTQRTAGVSVVGVAVLGAWAATAVVAYRARSGDLVALHTTAAAGFAVNLLAAARITGQVWDYLVLWAWGTTVMVLLAIGATVAYVVVPRLAAAGPRAALAAGAAAVAVGLGAGVASAVEATDAGVPFSGQSRTLDVLAPQLAGRLDPDGRYVFTWDDTFANGMATQGLALDLQRAGFAAGTDPEQEYMVGEARTVGWDEATDVLAYVTGPEAIARWRAQPGVVEVAHSEPPAADARRLPALRGDLAAAAVDAGHPELLATLDTSVWNFAIDPRVPDELIPRVRELMDLAVPTSVFLVPVPSG